MASNLELALELLPRATWDTLYMVLASTFFSILIGMPLGIILTLTDRNHLHPHPFFHRVLGSLINMGRSFPFAILIIALIPFTQLIVGTSLGTSASIVPLTIAAAPFLARIVENALKEVSRELIETSLVMGASTVQIIFKVLIPEAFPSLILGTTLTLISLVGYSAMAGLVGGGGLGKVAIQYGYNLFNTPIMISTIVILLLLVELIQWIGNGLTKKLYKKCGVIKDD